MNGFDLLALRDAIGKKRPVPGLALLAAQRAFVVRGMRLADWVRPGSTLAREGIVAAAVVAFRKRK